MTKKLCKYSGEGQVVDPDITHVQVEEGVSEIPAQAFENCDQLQWVLLPQGLRVIHREAFSGCTQLKTIELPNSLQSINIQAFYNTGLTYVFIPDSVDFIGNGAFEYAEELKKIRFPQPNCNLEENICSSCTTLVEAELPQDLPNIPMGTFFYCSKLTRVDIPSNVKSIGLVSFTNCHALQSIDLPEGLEAIHESAFDECSNIKTVELPRSLRRIDISAFMECLSLQKIKFRSLEHLTWGHSVLKDCPSLYQVDLPSTTLNRDARSQIIHNINMENPIFHLAGFQEDGRRAISFDTPFNLWPRWITMSSALWRGMRGTTRNTLLYGFLRRESVCLLENRVS